MPFSPQDVIYPKNRISEIVEIVHDGTKNDPSEFSVAKVELHDGSEVYGVRYNISAWNKNNPDVGYPTSRGRYPLWFILPDIEILLPILNRSVGIGD